MQGSFPSPFTYIPLPTCVLQVIPPSPSFWQPVGLSPLSSCGLPFPYFHREVSTLSEEREREFLENTIGGPGVDTEWERRQLEYRPNLVYRKPIIDSTIGDTRDADDIDVVEDELKKPAIRDMWKEVIGVVNKLKQLEQELSEELRDVGAIIPEDMLEEAKRAALRYGETVIDSIPFSLYKKALKDRPSQERQVIMDLFEDYHADVDGDIRAEVYADVFEMMEDWEEMLTFIKQGVFSQIATDVVLTEDGSFIDKLEQREIEEGMAYEELQEEVSGLIEDVTNWYITDPYSEQVAQYEERLKKLEAELEEKKRQLYTKKETIDIVQSKARMANVSTDMVQIARKFSPFEGEIEKILVALILQHLQYGSGQSLQNGLRKLQVMLKLLIDGKNDRLVEKKANLRNLSGKNSRTRINNALISGIHLRNAVFSDLLKKTATTPKDKNQSPAFQMAMEQIVGSLKFSSNLYKQNIVDFYKIHTLESELRSDKIHGLLDKDSARQLYKLIDKLINYAKTRNSWPTSSNITEWVRLFLSSQKLK